MAASDTGGIVRSGRDGRATRTARAATNGFVLDESTNHLHLPSIERLEEALAAYRGALILITHDDTLSSAVTDTFWEVTPAGVA